MKLQELKQLIKEVISEEVNGHEDDYSPQYRFQLTCDYRGYEPYQIYFKSAEDAIEYIKSNNSENGSVGSYVLFEIKREIELPANLTGNKKIKNEALTNPHTINSSDLQNKIEKARALIQNVLKVPGNDVGTRFKLLSQALEVLTENKTMLREFGWEQGRNFRQSSLKQYENNPRYKPYIDFWDKFIQPKLSKTEVNVMTDFENVVKRIDVNTQKTSAAVIDFLRKSLANYTQKERIKADPTNPNNIPQRTTIDPT